VPAGKEIKDFLESQKQDLSRANKNSIKTPTILYRKEEINPQKLD
jgi:hypothetical protein